MKKEGLQNVGLKGHIEGKSSKRKQRDTCQTFANG